MKKCDKAKVFPTLTGLSITGKARFVLPKLKIFQDHFLVRIK